MRWLIAMSLAACSAAPVQQAAPVPAPRLTAQASGARKEGRQAARVVDVDPCGFLVDTIYFAHGSAVPEPHQRPALDETAQMFTCLERHGDHVWWEVEGHADLTEPDPVELSELRAQVVIGELVKCGVAADTLTARAYGASSPSDRRGTPDARDRNRRVAFIAHRPSR